MKSQIWHQLAWKYLRLKGCDCLTCVPIFILIIQAVYELLVFETLIIGHARTHTHTYIRTPAGK